MKLNRFIFECLRKGHRVGLYKDIDSKWIQTDFCMICGKHLKKKTPSTASCDKSGEGVTQ